MKKLLLFIIFLTQLKIANAALFIDPSNPTQTLFVQLAYNSIATVNISPSFSFAGSAKTQVYVSTNGLLGLGSSSPSTTESCTNIGTGTDSTGLNQIALMKENLFISDANGTISYKTDNTTYHAFTYNLISPSNASVLLYTFQAVLITANTIINGFTLLAGDIVISYDNIINMLDSPSFCYPKIGVAWGAADNFTYLPGAGAGGAMTNPALLPQQESTFGKFSYNGSNYQYSIMFLPTNLLANVVQNTSYLLTDLTNSYDLSVQANTPNLAVSFPFFQDPKICNCLVTTSGCINFNNSNVSGCTPIGAASNTISIFNTDLQLYAGSGGYILETIYPNYSAYTWYISQNGSASTKYVFQAVLFNGTETLRGNTFSPGEIVFSYGGVYSNNICPDNYIANSGLTKDIMTSIASPNTDNGKITGTSFFPINGGIRFTPTIGGTYTTGTFTFSP